LYDLYIERESENLLEMISKEEDRLKDLKKQLENEKDKRNNKEYTKEQINHIKKMSDVWDYLSTKEKNKILKECVDKIIITNEDIEIYFRTF
jgi:site-specific DNA recombinase